MRRSLALVASLLLGGALGSLGGDGATFAAGLVGGLGPGTVLAAFAPDDEQPRPARPAPPRRTRAWGRRLPLRQRAAVGDVARWPATARVPSGDGATPRVTQASSWSRAA